MFSFKDTGPLHTCMYVNTDALCDVLRYQYIKQHQTDTKHKTMFLEQYSPWANNNKMLDQRWLDTILTLNQRWFIIVFLLWFFFLKTIIFHHSEKKLYVVFKGYWMYIVKYSALVYMAETHYDIRNEFIWRRTHELASASPPYEWEPNIHSITCLLYTIYINVLVSSV